MNEDNVKAGSSTDEENNSIKRIVGYYSAWVTDEEIQNTMTGYTHLLFGFWLTPNCGVLGAAEAIVGSKTIMTTIKENNIKCILSAGGSTESPVQDYDATKWGEALAEYAVTHQFDGVDLDIEGFVFYGDDALDSWNWLIDATNAIKAYSITNNYPLEISHAPQAPYFTGDNGYVLVEKGTNNAIDYYNIQYYNQGTSQYQSYECYKDIFPKTWQGINNETSIESIIASGIPASKLVVGKPIAKVDLAGTGFIKPCSLAGILIEADNNKVPFGGVMGWTVSSDHQGKWGSLMNSALQLTHKMYDYI